MCDSEWVSLGFVWEGESEKVMDEVKVSPVGVKSGVKEAVSVFKDSVKVRDWDWEADEETESESEVE
jgi:hypothetical protein